MDNPVGNAHVRYFRGKTVRVHMKLSDGSYTVDPVAVGKAVGRDVTQNGVIYVVFTDNQEYFLARPDEIFIEDSKAEPDYSPF